MEHSIEEQGRGPGAKLQDLTLQYGMQHINGWGIDADPHNTPAYPMKQRIETGPGSSEWVRPIQQTTEVEILHSIERPNLSAVFGTPGQPRGLSGMLRRFAFKYSEGTFTHWLALLVADRVDTVEGVVDDLAHGHVPNLVAETGLKAQWEHDRARVITKVAVGAAVVAAFALVVTRKRRH